jgi:magnesium transporter
VAQRTEEAETERRRDLREAAPRSSVCHVLGHESSGEIRFTRENVEKLLSRKSFFWVDIDSPTESDFGILRDVFHFHPLAVEDSETFDQRAKIDDYDDFVFLVVYGAAGDADRLVEVHCFYSERVLVTVHRDDAPAFVELRRRYLRRHAPVDEPPLLLYKIVDALVDSFFPLLAELDDRIDAIEDQTFVDAGQEQLQQIFDLKRMLVGMRKAVTPQRDAFAGVTAGVVELPGVTAAETRYFRDVYDHLIRISDLIDTYRDLLTSAMDVYLSTVSNRLNGVMKQLAVIATIFLPLTFITGFFGQNFGWMVRNVNGWEEFLWLGIGAQLLTLAGLLLMFRRRGWF